MKSNAIVCAIAAVTLGFSSLSFAQDQRGPGRDRDRDQRYEQRGPQDRDGRGFDRRDNARNDDRRGGQRGYEQRNDNRHRGFDQRDARNDRNFRYYNARGPEFRRGGHVPPQYRSQQYYVSDWRGHRLSAPPRGQQWVQVGSDYVLIALATGIIASMVLNSN